jgi:crossover junction endodeoxyribonuclease RuvC
MKTILGIDPGMAGALSAWNGHELSVYDMPTFTITKGKTLRKRIDIPALKRIVELNDFETHVFIEQVSAQPGNGSAAAFTYGFGCGVIEAVVQCCGLAFTYVPPQTWKKAMSCPKDKDGARQRASQLFPGCSHNWDLKKHDGRAEASLIALYGFNKTITHKD